jgi:hypothetical protein
MTAYLVEVAGESFPLRDSEPALQLLVLSSQQLQVLVGAGLVSTAQDGNLDVVAELVEFADDLLQLRVRPRSVDNLRRWLLATLLVVVGPGEGGAEQRHGLACPCRTLDQGMRFFIEALEHVGDERLLRFVDFVRSVDFDIIEFVFVLLGGVPDYYFINFGHER